MTEIGLLALAALAVFLVILATTARGIGSLPVRPAPLMTKRERIVCAMIERAVPHARVHAQVSMGAILRPARGLDPGKSSPSLSSTTEHMTGQPTGSGTG